MLRRLLINDQPSFASIGYSHQQLWRVPRGTANRHSQFHCPKSKISTVVFALEEDNNRDWVLILISSYTFFSLINFRI